MTAKIQEFSSEEAPPDTDNPGRAAYEKLRAEVQSLQDVSHFLSFQKMLIGGFGENQFANDYKTACDNL